MKLLIRISKVTGQRCIKVEELLIWRTGYIFFWTVFLLINLEIASMHEAIELVDFWTIFTVNFLCKYKKYCSIFYILRRFRLDQFRRTIRLYSMVRSNCSEHCSDSCGLVSAYLGCIENCNDPNEGECFFQTIIFCFINNFAMQFN